MKSKNRMLFYSLMALACIFILTNTCKQDDDNTPLNTVKDIDGNVYHTVTIGTQVWMVENLKTTKYNDGTNIPNVIDATSWSGLNTPACCWYNNAESPNKANYGALYNWYALNTGKLCPKGWHVPSASEWNLLLTYLGGFDVAGGKLKEQGTSHWLNPNVGATNETGFTALPGGYRNIDGTFSSIGENGFWWSSAEYSYSPSTVWIMYLNSTNGDVYSDYYNKSYGFSVRCIKD